MAVTNIATSVDGDKQEEFTEEETNTSLAGSQSMCNHTEDQLTEENHTELKKRLSHKQFRALIKKQKRKEKRQAEARKLEEQQACVQKSPDTLSREAYEERQQKVKQEYEDKLRISQNLHWLDKERRAQQQFQYRQEWLAKEKQRREDEEKKIREEWETRQRGEEEEKQQEVKKKERQVTGLVDTLVYWGERSHRVEELLKEATKHEKKPGESPWHNPLAPETRPGIERDLCPFFIKVGACRFGDRCSRTHQYPDSSTTLLFPGMYSHFKLEHSLKDEYDTDLGLEYEDSEMYQHFRDFFNDTLPEFQKHGQVVQFKVCCNQELHLRGNLYVQFVDEASALQAYMNFNGRWYGGKQLSCQFCVVEKWRHAICGVFSKNRCPKGRNCNFIHAFRNPGNLFWQADRDIVVQERYSSRTNRHVRRSRSRSPSRMSSRSKQQSRSPERWSSRSYRSSSRMSSRSYRRRSRSPGRSRSRSPRRRSRSPQRSRSRSPKRRSRSPRRRSRSPGSSRSYRRRSRSPRTSRSRSPRRRSRSPRRSSRSPSRSHRNLHQRSMSPYQDESKSQRETSACPPRVSLRSERRRSRSPVRYNGSSSRRRQRSYSPVTRDWSRSPDTETERETSSARYNSKRSSPDKVRKSVNKDNTNLYGCEEKTTTEEQPVCDNRSSAVSALFCETPPYVDMDSTPEYITTDPVQTQQGVDSVLHTVSNSTWDDSSVGFPDHPRRDLSWSEEREVRSHDQKQKSKNERREQRKSDGEERDRAGSRERYERREHRKRKYRTQTKSSHSSTSEEENSSKYRKRKQKRKKAKKSSRRREDVRYGDRSPELSGHRRSKLLDSDGEKMSHKPSDAAGTKDAVEENSSSVKSYSENSATSGNKNTIKRATKVLKKLSFKVLKKPVEANVIAADQKVLSVFKEEDGTSGDEEGRLSNENTGRGMEKFVCDVKSSSGSRTVVRDREVKEGSHGRQGRSNEADEVVDKMMSGKDSEVVGETNSGSRLLNKNARETTDKFVVCDTDDTNGACGTVKSREVIKKRKHRQYDEGDTMVDKKMPDSEVMGGNTSSSRSSNKNARETVDNVLCDTETHCGSNKTVEKSRTVKKGRQQGKRSNDDEADKEMTEVVGHTNSSSISISSSRPNPSIAKLLEEMPEREVVDRCIVSNLNNKNRALEFLDSVIADIENT